ncbi:hypothetical protein VPHD51_0170 [Vibrio phage D51]
MIVQTIEVFFTIQSSKAEGGEPDMVVEQHELNYLKDFMGDCVDQAIFQYGEGDLATYQARHYTSLHYTISHIQSYQDAQIIERILKDTAVSLLLEIGETE